MRIGGLDVGDKTIGVAISDEMGWTAQGLEVIRRRSLEQDLDRLRQIARQYGIALWVVGMPRNMNGTYGPRAELTRQFMAQLAEHSGLPVEPYDERMTTMAAERILLEADLSRARRKQVIDKMAACVILQGYLDRLASRRQSAPAPADEESATEEQ